MKSLPFSLVAFFLPAVVISGYELVQDYSGISFFDQWDFYGSWDNLTLGDVWWLNRDDAFKQQLAYINSAGNAVMKVDNTNTVVFNEKRASIRITSQQAYGVGSLWVADMVHIPFGCSVWPAFWTKGPTWPDNGEIDIMEAINLMQSNQMALHTLPGCFQSTPANQMGTSGELDCSQPSGCLVTETAPNSFGQGFAAAGGGVFAAQFDVAGIWFWSRPNIPQSILQSTSTSSLDVSDWGAPSASYPVSGCDITKFFTAQNLILDITLCGIWAGLPAQYLPACGGSGPTGICYNDNVVGSGSRYDDAYFEVKYVRAYTTPGSGPTPTAVAANAASFTPMTSSSSAGPTLSQGGALHVHCLMIALMISLTMMFAMLFL
ncbi:concanavalin A-like lectin/glucanase domain-containing protein [Crucibulum laeve]|uniref:Concanavalin A-like lectin/glucanase domain-containing protein n=1 Tax=Crucibulum laeve TaxID=68775 RepID=A0A5C3M083_9AGAR|nr:concanavalin A-like lectin/glucanase domain-containing protein [Crucibulum laeve]